MLLHLDGESFFPVPCPAISMIDFRPYFMGQQSGRLAIFDDGLLRILTEAEVNRINECKKHDRIPPWEKALVFSGDGLAQLQIEVRVKDVPTEEK